MPEPIPRLLLRVFPLPAEAGILPQMSVHGVARYVRGLARENHLRIQAKSREERFPPRKCPFTRLFGDIEIKVPN
jgi:hypothetical protein